eukprot:jgi/Bigna1/73948/fgenesh1_pg.27_\
MREHFHLALAISSALLGALVSLATVAHLRRIYGLPCDDASEGSGEDSRIASRNINKMPDQKNKRDDNLKRKNQPLIDTTFDNVRSPIFQVFANVYAILLLVVMQMFIPNVDGSIGPIFLLFGFSAIFPVISLLTLASNSLRLTGTVRYMCMLGNSLSISAQCFLHLFIYLGISDRSEYRERSLFASAKTDVGVCNSLLSLVQHHQLLRGNARICSTMYHDDTDTNANAHYTLMTFVRAMFLPDGEILEEKDEALVTEKINNIYGRSIPKRGFLADAPHVSMYYNSEGDPIYHDTKTNKFSTHPPPSPPPERLGIHSRKDEKTDTKDSSDYGAGAKEGGADRHNPYSEMLCGGQKTLGCFPTGQVASAYLVALFFILLFTGVILWGLEYFVKKAVQQHVIADNADMGGAYMDTASEKALSTDLQATTNNIALLVSKGVVGNVRSYIGNITNILNETRTVLDRGPYAHCEDLSLLAFSREGAGMLKDDDRVVHAGPPSCHPALSKSAPSEYSSAALNRTNVSAEIKNDVAYATSNVKFLLDFSITQLTSIKETSGIILRYLATIIRAIAAAFQVAVIMASIFAMIISLLFMFYILYKMNKTLVDLIKGQYHSLREKRGGSNQSNVRNFDISMVPNFIGYFAMTIATGYIICFLALFLILFVLSFKYTYELLRIRSIYMSIVAFLVGLVFRSLILQPLIVYLCIEDGIVRRDRKLLWECYMGLMAIYSLLTGVMTAVNRILILNIAVVAQIFRIDYTVFPGWATDFDSSFQTYKALLLAVVWNRNPIRNQAARMFALKINSSKKRSLDSQESKGFESAVRSMISSISNVVGAGKQKENIEGCEVVSPCGLMEVSVTAAIDSLKPVFALMLLLCCCCTSQSKERQLTRPLRKDLENDRKLSSSSSSMRVFKSEGGFGDSDIGEGRAVGWKTRRRRLVINRWQRAYTLLKIPQARAQRHWRVKASLEKEKRTKVNNDPARLLLRGPFAGACVLVSEEQPRNYS